MSIYWVSLLLKLVALATAASVDLESRIQNGDVLGLNQKHVVQIKTLFYPPSADQEDTLFCTASILNERWIITARHCLHKDGQQIASAQVINHMFLPLPQPIAYADVQYPPFNVQHTFAQDDIALMKLATPIPLNDGDFQLIALDNNYPSQGATAVVAGYGDPKPNQPRQGVVTLSSCARASLCSFSTGTMARPDHGDSGGPVMVNGKLVGIISEGIEGSVYEEHYAAIADHYAWIMSVIHT